MVQAIARPVGAWISASSGEVAAWGGPGEGRLRPRAGGTPGSALIDRADGNSDRLGGLCRRKHVAPAVEDAAGLDDQAGRVNLAGDNALGLDLDTALRENDPIEPAGDDDVVALNLALDSGGLTQDKALLRDNVTLHLAIQAEGAGELEGALQLYPLVQEADPVVAGALLRPARRSPAHGSPQG